MAVWLTVGFFEVTQARVNVGGSLYENSFQCIPATLPAPPLLDRLQRAMTQRELLPYLEVRAIAGKASDVLRLDRVRVTGISPMTAQQTRQVTIVAEM